MRDPETEMNLMRRLLSYSSAAGPARAWHVDVMQVERDGRSLETFI